MTATDDRPARIWLDLTQHSPGYTSDPDEVREGDTEFVRADLVLDGKPNLAALRAEMSETCAMLLEASEYLQLIADDAKEEGLDARYADRLARALRDLAGEGAAR